MLYTGGMPPGSERQAVGRSRRAAARLSRADSERPQNSSWLIAAGTKPTNPRGSGANRSELSISREIGGWAGGSAAPEATASNAATEPCSSKPSHNGVAQA